MDMVQRKERNATPRPPRVQGLDYAEDEPDGSLEGDIPRRPRDGWSGRLGYATRTWWRHHPAHMAVEMVTPALADYAHRRPGRLLGISAAVGAALVLVRPWKLISATGLLVALLKSSQLSTLVMSAMSAADYQRDEEQQR